MCVRVYVLRSWRGGKNKDFAEIEQIDLTKKKAARGDEPFSRNTGLSWLYKSACKNTLEETDTCELWPSANEMVWIW